MVVPSLVVSFLEGTTSPLFPGKSFTFATHHVKKMNEVGKGILVRTARAGNEIANQKL